ncbi:MAG: transcription antitermination factor NusB [Candidatus Eisenbacteria bacterium]
MPERRRSGRPVDPVRRAALQLLIESERDPGPLKPLLEERERAIPRADDRALLHSLVLETLRHRARLDRLLQGWIAPRRLEELAPEVRNLLRLGLAQLVLHDRIGAHAAVDTSEPAHAVAHAGVAGFVNAVLRRAAREGRSAWAAVTDDSAVSAFALRYSVPEWIVGRWLARWGSGRTEAALAHSQSHPDYWLRLSPALDLARLESSDRVARDTNAGWIPGTRLAAAGSHPAEWSEFTAGLFTIQDGSAILVGLLPPRVAGRVLDLCAAPGTKTSHLLERAEPGTRIVAADLSSRRLSLLARGLERWPASLARPGIDLVVSDGGALPFSLAFDGILIDAPCSNLGVLRRRVDLRWRAQEQEIPRLAEVQASLLRSAASRLLDGGWLVYSVCTTEPEETTAQRDRFLAEHREWGPLPLPECVPESARLREGEFLLVPGEHATDGSYAFIVTRGQREERRPKVGTAIDEQGKG